MAVKPRLSRKGLLLFSGLTDDNGSRHGGAEKRLKWFLYSKTSSLKCGLRSVSGRRELSRSSPDECSTKHYRMWIFVQNEE
jgi:hypothetical protein